MEPPCCSAFRQHQVALPGGSTKSQSNIWVLGKACQYSGFATGHRRRIPKRPPAALPVGTTCAPVLDVGDLGRAK
jgi:hypothetical protein